MVTDASGRVRPNAPGGGWRVESQQETMLPDPGGRVVTGIQVYFVTAGGHRGSVFLPRNLYNVQNVQAAVAALAHEMDQVGNLSG